MKYEYCNECPAHIETHEWDDHDLFGHVPYANGHCGQVFIERGELKEKKPRMLYNSFARPIKFIPPIWCPHRGTGAESESDV